MRDDREFHERLAPGTIENIQRVATSDAKTFVDLAADGGMDPATDFRGTDLAEIDFSNCDLRGFDFRHADLTGCYGIDTQWDESTLLDGANLSGSIFAYARGVTEAINDHPEWSREYKRVRGHWTHTLLQIGGRLRRPNPTEMDVQIAQALLVNSDDALVRTNLVYFLSPVFKSRGGYRDLLMHLLATRASDAKLLATVLRAAADFFPDDAMLARLALLHARSDDTRVRDAALSALVRSAHVTTMMEEVHPVLRGEDNERYRRLLVANQVRRNRDLPEGVMAEPAGPSIAIDFQQPISAEKLERMSKRVPVQGNERADRVLLAWSSLEEFSRRTGIYFTLTENAERLVRARAAQATFKASGSLETAVAGIAGFSSVGVVGSIASVSKR